MTARPHLPVIRENIAACTCGRWTGPTRQPAQSEGIWTIEAYEAHGQHVQTIHRSTRHDGQAQLFGQVDLFEVNQQ